LLITVLFIFYEFRMCTVIYFNSTLCCHFFQKRFFMKYVINIGFLLVIRNCHQNWTYIHLFVLYKNNWRAKALFYSKLKNLRCDINISLRYYHWYHIRFANEVTAVVTFNPSFCLLLCQKQIIDIKM